MPVSNVLMVAAVVLFVFAATIHVGWVPLSTAVALIALGLAVWVTAVLVR